MGSQAPALCDRWLALDPLLTQRDPLLDPSQVIGAAERLGVAAGPDPLATRLSTRYRVGCSLDVVWHLRSRSPRAAERPAGSILVLRARADDRRAAGTASGFDPMLGATWWLLPDDPELPAAGALLAAAPELSAALALSGWCSSTPAGYAPGRWLRVEAADHTGRPLAQLTTFASAPPSDPHAPPHTHGEAFGPVGGPGVDTLAARHELVARWFDLCPRPGIATPDVAARAGSVLGLEAPTPGTGAGPWAAAGPQARSAWLGEALGHLHDLPAEAAEGLAGPDRRWSPEALEAAAEAVARVRPDLARALLDVLARLDHRPGGGELALLHGDPGPGRLIGRSAGRRRADRAVTLTGLEHARLGAPEADLGAALAAVLVGGAGERGAGAGAPAQAVPSVEALVQGYRQRREPPAPETTRWHVGAALVGVVARRAVTRLDPVGLRALPATVQAAADVLDGRLLNDGQLEGLGPTPNPARQGRAGPGSG